MGPDHGPGFTQIYTEKLKKFEIIDTKDTLYLKNYNITLDTDNLHRRDYNMAPQIFPDGERGFTVFSGVFQKTEDIPFLNTVDINATNHKVKENFNQYLSQYHSAKLPLFDSVSNTMQTLFFGGMSQFTLGNDSVMVEDKNVPFVKTISKISRYSDGSMKEIKLSTEIPQEKTLIGYIYGGIESSAANVFFINDGTQSSASNVIFKVYINKSTVGIKEDLILKGDHIFNLNIYPNPANNELNYTFFNPNKSKFEVKILDSTGKECYSEKASWTSGDAKDKIDITNLSKGSYIIQLSNGVYSSFKHFIKQ